MASGAALSKGERTVSYPGELLHRVQARSRRQKLDRLLEHFQPSPRTTVLEVGVGNTEPLPVTNFLVRNYPWPERVTALGVGDLSGFKRLHPEIPTVSYDGGTFPFRDDAFELAHSNAVIEHVGATSRQEAFVAEMVRVARAGMLTTPNRFFPIETHTLLPMLHWLGKERFDEAIARLGPERIEAAFRRIGRTFPTDELADLRLLGVRDLARMARAAGLTDFKVLKNRVGPWAMTLSLVWRR
jgi:hypothetical protein